MTYPTSSIPSPNSTRPNGWRLESSIAATSFSAETWPKPGCDAICSAVRS